MKINASAAAVALENRACDYCGLPLPGETRRPSSIASAEAGAADGRPAEYCCFGCRLAAEITGERGQRGLAHGTLIRIGLSIFLSLNVMMFTMALWSQDFYAADDVGSQRLAAPLADLFRRLCLVLSLPVLYLLGGPLCDHAWRRGWRGMLSTDALILLGVTAAFGYSCVSVWRGAGHVYFEVGCAVLVMVTLGRWLEANGKLQATEALEALEKLLPDRVRLVTDDAERWVALKQIAGGDRLRILAGERIPIDGRVLLGSAALDQQLLTGESRPRSCSAGDAVLAGSLNLDGELLVEATAPADEGALARLLQLVRAARASKGRYQRLADRVASCFLPAVLAIAVAALVWHGWRSGFEAALLSSLAVLLIACPCALGLATPLAVTTAMGSAAQSHVLFRHGEALERLAEVRAVRFDKTGTLTTGTPRVSRFAVGEAGDEREARLRAGALAAASNHLYAQAIIRWCAEQPDRPAPAPRRGQLADVRNHPGRGVSGRFAGEQDESRLGSARWLKAAGLRAPEELANAIAAACDRGDALSAVGWDGVLRAVFVFEEEIRPTTAAALAACRRLGLDVEILTGDHRARAAVLAAELDAPVVAELLPEEKVAALAQARARFGPVAMVGDGVNDAPALAAADLGIALRCGADVSRESAQICLLGDDPAQVPWTVELARRTVRVIRWNLLWAFGYNAVGVGLAAAGMLNPAWAALAMVLSSTLVIGNSLRLKSAGTGADATGARRSEARRPAPHRPADQAPRSENIDSTPAVRAPLVESQTRDWQAATLARSTEGAGRP